MLRFGPALPGEIVFIEIERLKRLRNNSVVEGPTPSDARNITICFGAGYASVGVGAALSIVATQENKKKKHKIQDHDSRGQDSVPFCCRS